MGKIMGSFFGHGDIKRNLIFIDGQINGTSHISLN